MDISRVKCCSRDFASFFKFSILLMIILTAMISWAIRVEELRPTCFYCGEKFAEKPTTVWDKYLFCERCWSEWDKRASYVFGNKYCKERIEWIMAGIFEMSGKHYHVEQTDRTYEVTDVTKGIK